MNEFVSECPLILYKILNKSFVSDEWGREMPSPVTAKLVALHCVWDVWIQAIPVCETRVKSSDASAS